jgi:hypothetical protein
MLMPVAMGLLLAALFGVCFAFSEFCSRVVTPRKEGR